VMKRLGERSDSRMPRVSVARGVARERSEASLAERLECAAVTREDSVYSALRAMTGSTRAARRAGMNAAANATANSRLVTPANV